MSEVNEMIIEKGYNYTMNVWEGFIYHPYTKMLISRCDAASDSAFNIATEMQDKRGGPDNAIIFSIPTSKTVTASLGNFAFDETWLSLQTGEKLSYGEYVIYGRAARCDVKTESGKRTITLPEKPYNKYIAIASGSKYINVEIAGDTNTVDVTSVTGANDKCLEVVYDAQVKSKQLDIQGSTPPSTVMLVLKKKIRRGKGGDITGIITITLPNFQLDGNLEMASALGDTDTMTLNGTAQAAASTECGGSEQAVGSMNIEDIDKESQTVMEISAPESYEIKQGETERITVWASIGSDLVYEPFDVTDECTYESSDKTKVTVSEDGTIEAIAESATPIDITITYQNRTTKTSVQVLSGG
jgi:hypothetical protein